jgi:hypothetical protein
LKYFISVVPPAFIGRNRDAKSLDVWRSPHPSQFQQIGASIRDCPQEREIRRWLKSTTPGASQPRVFSLIRKRFLRSLHSS